MGVLKQHTWLIDKLISATQGIDTREGAFSFDNLNLEGMGINRDAYDAMAEDARDFGMPIELMVDAVKKRREQGESDFTMDDIKMFHSIAMNNITREANVNNRAGFVSANPVVSILMGWAFSQTQGVANALTDQQGRHSLRLFAKFLATSVFVASSGLLFSELKDWYNYTFRGRAPRTRNPLQASSPQEFLAITTERVNEAGVFGIWGEVANKMVSFNLDLPGDRRTLDERIFVVNAMNGLFGGLMDAVRQGSTITDPLRGISFETNGQRMLRAVGGGSAIQYAEILNNFFPEETEELPIVGRSFFNPLRGNVEKINSTMLLTAAGRSLEIPMKKGFGQATATELGMEVKRMQMAMYNNDEAEFARAYRDAIQASIKENPDKDPVQRVAQRWGGRNPLFPFESVSQAKEEIEEILAFLPDKFRPDVVEALNLYETYSQLIQARGNGFALADDETDLALLEQEALAKVVKRSVSARSGLAGLSGLGGLASL